MLKMKFTHHPLNKIVSPLSSEELNQVISVVVPSFLVMARNRYLSLNIDEETLKDLEQDTLLYAHETLAIFDKSKMPADKGLNETASWFLNNRFNFSYVDLMAEFYKQNEINLY